MSAFLTDGDWTKKWPIGKPRKSYPIERDLTCYILEQDYMQLLSSYSAAALNTTHYTAMGGASPTDGGSGGDSTAYLIAISGHQDAGAGIIKWTESYSTKPADRNEYESFAYNFIGLYGDWGQGVTTVTGRDRLTQSVTSRLAFKYYIPGVDGGITTAADIPIIAAQLYYYSSTVTLNVDYLANSPPFAAATSPTRSAYEAVVAGGSGLGTGAGTGEIIAEQSVIRPWRGGFYERVTRYIKAI